jgi:hypothetical protein
VRWIKTQIGCELPIDQSPVRQAQKVPDQSLQSDFLERLEGRENPAMQSKDVLAMKAILLMSLALHLVTATSDDKELWQLIGSKRYEIGESKNFLRTQEISL